MARNSRTPRLEAETRSILHGSLAVDESFGRVSNSLDPSGPSCEEGVRSDLRSNVSAWRASSEAFLRSYMRRTKICLRRVHASHCEVQLTFCGHRDHRTGSGSQQPATSAFGQAFSQAPSSLAWVPEDEGRRAARQTWGLKGNRDFISLVCRV